MKSFIDTISWFIPIKKYRDNFKKFLFNFFQKEVYANSKYSDLSINQKDSNIKKIILKDISNNPNFYIDNYKLEYFYLIRSVINYVINDRPAFITNYKELSYDMIKLINNKKTKDSKLVNKYLSGLRGIEIGGASFSDFGINAVNINIVSNIDNTEYNYEDSEEYKWMGYLKDVNFICNGNQLPFKDNSVDFVFSSHVIEHFYDPISALLEWNRVVKNGGYIFLIIPHKERTFDKDRKRTTLEELINRHKETKYNLKNDYYKHHSVWVTEDFLELCKYLDFNVVDYQDMDDAVSLLTNEFNGLGFSIVIHKDQTRPDQT
ncbi:methyltransferase domain-containing protein [Brachyspira hyodysenteriae]|uniref:methyltransferase domain-containing protein n=1 Tax=Brachyspira hyodysenteriae TaxID=159 RepID=UPI00069A39AB|nr:methyltransferase domain-containing protein [Brachyspira hyodysenteriae]